MSLQMTIFITFTLVFCFHVFSAESRSVNPGCNLVFCKMNPCNSFRVMAQCSNHPGAECRPNYCGGCSAEFYMNGVPLRDCFDITLLG